MGATGTEVHDDVRRLIDLLAYISGLLHWIVEESDLIPEPDLRGRFRDGLPEVRQRIELVRDELGSVFEGSSRWQQLTAVGLTGPQLTMKVSVLDWLVSKAAPLKPILSWINSFLGSLSKVFPGLDIVQEYKEQVELVVEHQHCDGPTPGVKPILDLR